MERTARGHGLGSPASRRPRPPTCLYRTPMWCMCSSARCSSRPARITAVFPSPAESLRSTTACAGRPPGTPGQSRSSDVCHTIPCRRLSSGSVPSWSMRCTIVPERSMNDTASCPSSRNHCACTCRLGPSSSSGLGLSRPATGLRELRESGRQMRTCEQALSNGRTGRQGDFLHGTIGCPHLRPPGQP